MSFFMTTPLLPMSKNWNRKDKSFTVPSSTKEIGMCSFANCSSIENINIYNCTKINAGAFGSCKNLKSITASKSLKYIYQGLFK